MAVPCDAYASGAASAVATVFKVRIMISTSIAEPSASNRLKTKPPKPAEIAEEFIAGDAGHGRARSCFRGFRGFRPFLFFLIVKT
jgi:hypothetical protein